MACATALASVLLLSACGSGPREERDPGPRPSAELPGRLQQDRFVDTVVDAMVEARTMHVEMSVTSGRATVFASEGDLRIGDPSDPTQTEFAITSDSAQTGRIDLRKVDGVVYTGRADGAGTTYAATNVSDSSSAAPDTSSLSVVEQTMRFAGAVIDVERSGPGPRLDGARTTEYVVTIDPRRVKAGFAQKYPDVSTLEYHFFLDREDRPRRFELTVPGGRGRVVLDQTRWGEPVDIKAPPSEQVRSGPAGS